LRELQKTLALLGAGAVTIHYVVAENRLNLLLTTPTSQIARSVAVERRNLEQKIEFFRVALRNPAISAEPMARELHKMLIAPLAGDLAQAQARTLMLALDGNLRYIPFAALHDGGGYLIERYDIALLTEVARDNLNHRPGATATIAGLGVTRQIEDFSPLPAVKAELESIVNQGKTGLVRGELRKSIRWCILRAISCSGPATNRRRSCCWATATS
jgi:CHAT domain-containing protein